MNITVGIPTRERYNELSHCLLSIALQTYLPIEIIIVDDTPNPTDLRTIPIYKYIFQLFDDKKVEWKIMYGAHKGAHYSHQLVQEIAKGDWIFRIDDDEIAEPDCLSLLKKNITGWTDNIGAIAPLVIMPNAEVKEGIKYSTRFKNIPRNEILILENPNVQWYRYEISSVTKERWLDQDHLYSCFLYKKGISNYELNLSPVAHREETIFSYKIKKAGYELAVSPEAIVHHFRSATGGIRSHQDKSYYDHDEGVFRSLLSLWNVNKDAKKVVVLDNGIGDHFAFKHILPELKLKHKKIQIACCFNDVFFDEPEIELISIADAYNMFWGCIDEFNVYRKMIDWSWKENLVSAFRKLYLQ